MLLLLAVSCGPGSPASAVVDVSWHRGVAPLTHGVTTYRCMDNTTPTSICARSLERIAQKNQY